MTSMSCKLIFRLYLNSYDVTVPVGCPGDTGTGGRASSEAFIKNDVLRKHTTVNKDVVADPGNHLPLGQ